MRHLGMFCVLLLVQTINSQTNGIANMIDQDNRTIIGKDCADSLQYYEEALANRTPWATEMYDAQGKLGAGILEGARRLIGSYDECKKVRVSDAIANRTTESFHGIYCTVDLVLNITDKLALVNQTNFIREICAPSTCTANDLEIYLRRIDYAFDVKVISCDAYQPDGLDLADYIIICVFALLGSIIALGTFLDSWFRSRGEKAIKKRAKVLIAFSAYTNTLKLLNTETGPSTITCIFGLRFLAMCFIILGHTYNFLTMMIPIVNPLSIQRGIKQLWFQAFLNFTPWVDTFFLISGLLLVTSGIRNFRTLHTKHEKTESFTKKGSDFFRECISLTVRRYWRLTPTLGFMIALYILSDEFSSGPNWKFMREGISSECKRTWWRNLLYINNFFPGDMCIGHSWYLCDDFQFYIFSFVILILLSSSFPIIGIALTIASLVASIVATAVTTFVSNSSPTSLAIEPDAEHESQKIILYIWPFFRIGPYLVGILLGFFIVEQKEFKLSKRKNLALWSCSILIVALITFASYRWTNGHPASLGESMVYSSIHRIAWAICWAFMICSCYYGQSPFINRFLSWKAFIPLSRLTYHAYLIHLLFIYIHNASNRTAFAFSHYNMFILFFGYLTISYLFAYLSAICFELPFANLEAELFPKTKAMTTPETNNYRFPNNQSYSSPSSNLGCVGSVIFTEKFQHINPGTFRVY